MAVISISRGSYYRGKEVATKLAEKLGYAIVSRDSLLDASDQFNIPEIKLANNIQHATQILERFAHGRERYIAFISAAILSHMKKDSVVYHGLAGQYFVQSVSHVLKVRVLGDLEARVKDEAARSGISSDEARFRLKQDDEERRKWALFLYGVDIEHPSRYDMVLNLKNMSVDEAVELIIGTVNLPCYQPTEASIQEMNNLALKAEVCAAMFDFPTARIAAADGQVKVTVKGLADQEASITDRINATLAVIDGIDQLTVRVEPYL